jgi:hypothetical protein
MHQQAFSHMRYLKNYCILNVKLDFEVQANMKNQFIFLIFIYVLPAGKCSLTLHILFVVQNLFKVSNSISA